jgi:hypothetical protein
MTFRGNKRVGKVATIIFTLIAVLTVAVAWLAVHGIQSAPSAPPVQREAVPGQAAQRVILPVDQAPTPTR